MSEASYSTICSEITCANSAVKAGRCAEHPGPFAGARRSAPALYASARWKRERAAFLVKHGRCSFNAGLLAACPKRATVVDHHEPHRGDVDLFWDQSNWRALCRYHHNVKTATEIRARRA